MSALASATRDHSSVDDADWEKIRRAVTQYRADSGEANKKVLAECIAEALAKGSTTSEAVNDAKTIEVLHIDEPNPVEMDFTYSIDRGPAAQGTLSCYRGSGIVYLIY